MSTPLTRQDLQMTTRGLPIADCERRGWQWQRYSRVRSTIKHATRQLRQGTSFHKILGCRKASTTQGHIFGSLETFI